MAMVLRAGKHSNVGGHIASYASAAVLYDVGFEHFFRGRTEQFGGDMVYIQGHSSPGIYGRAYLEGRLDEAQLDNFRRETDRDGVSSYPHPRLMPDFWQFPHGVHGARADHRRVPGAVHALPGRSRAEGASGAQSLGVPR
nr:hypothetical protein GCM10020185_19020 [Pseudomonas brassicacearum subsp. brassicacearum]